MNGKEATDRKEAIRSYCRNIGMLVATCLDSYECFFENFKDCPLGHKTKCPAYSILRKIQKKSPLFYTKWRETINQVASGSHVMPHSLNAVIITGIARFHAEFWDQVPSFLDENLIKKIKWETRAETIEGLQMFFDHDLMESLDFLQPGDALLVLKLFRMFVEGLGEKRKRK